MLWHEHVRRAGKLLVLGAAHYSGVLGWYRKRTMRNRALILMYHRVTPRQIGVPDYSPNGIAVTPQEFSMQMHFLRQHYNVVPLSDIVAALSGKRELDPNMAAVTFDDGWQDVYEFAFPILKEYRIPATIYLATGFIDGRPWFWEERFKYLLAVIHQACGDANCSRQDREQARRALTGFFASDLVDVGIRMLPAWLSKEAKRVRSFETGRREDLLAMLENQAARLAPQAKRPFMSWSEIRDMSQAGIEIGNHTDTHQALSELGVERATIEINRAAHRIREMLGQDAVNFAYPYGKYSQEVKSLLRPIGIGSATTTRLGLVKPDDDPYALNRVNMCSDVSAYRPLFAGRILGI